MIAFFPELYPDELLYSALARYFDKSGYMIYRAVAEDIYQNRLTNPDVIFLNPITDNLKSILIKQKTWKDIIMQHTMYPYYGRFLPPDRRRRAFQSLVNMDFKHKDALQMPKDGKSGERYLRYCPLCCQQDRDIYGETYWHRLHQMHDIRICPDHGCYLVDSEIPARSKKSPGLYSAECSISSMEVKMNNNTVERKLARYVSDLFQQEIIDTDVRFHVFLHEKITGTKYTSPRGEQKNVSLFFKDFMEYYREYTNNPVQELWQFQKIVDGKKYSAKEIALVAMFIGITPEELAKMEMPEELSHEAFDRRIRELHDQGFKYPQIAEIMGASYDVCKTIGNGRYYKYNKGRGICKGGIKAMDWDKMDRELLPKVREAIKDVRNDMGKPGRVTYGSVARHLGFSEKKYPNLRLCREEVEKNYETWEHYWAREMVFYYRKIKTEGKPVTVTAIMKMTNTRKHNLIRGIPYLDLYTDSETAAAIRELLTG